MHTFGKVMTWLMLPLVIAGVILAGQAINVRSSWMSAVGELERGNAQLKESIAQKEQQLSDLRHRAAILRRNWERSWDAADRNVTITDSATGDIAMPYGRLDGVFVAPSEDAPAPVLHAFAPNPNGGSRYIGPFRMTTVPRDSSSDMHLVWAPRPQELEQELAPWHPLAFQYWQRDVGTWPAGAWRFWQAIPTQYSNRFNGLLDDMNLTLQRLYAASTHLAQASQRNEKAKQQIADRIAEIQQGDQVAGAQRSPEDVQGLVTAINSEEQARNDLLAEVDDLRHHIHDAQQRLTELIEENRELVRSLPKPQPETAGVSVGNR